MTEFKISIQDESKLKNCFLALARSISGNINPLSFIPDREGYIRVIGGESLIESMKSFCNSIGIDAYGFVVGGSKKYDPIGCTDSLLKSVPGYSMLCSPCFIPQTDKIIFVKIKVFNENENYIKDLIVILQKMKKCFEKEKAGECLDSSLSEGTEVLA